MLSPGPSPGHISPPPSSSIVGSDARMSTGHPSDHVGGRLGQCGRHRGELESRRRLVRATHQRARPRSARLASPIASNANTSRCHSIEPSSRYDPHKPSLAPSLCKCGLRQCVPQRRASANIGWKLEMTKPRTIALGRQTLLGRARAGGPAIALASEVRA